MERIPCVTFNFIDHFKSLNLGQTLDQKCLDLVYQKIIQINPKVKIILYGFCRGALTVLNYLANKTNQEISNVKAVILDEPLTPDIKNIDLLYEPAFILPWILDPLHVCVNSLYRILKRSLPNRKTDETNVLTNSKKLPGDIPFYIGYIPTDPCGIDIEKVIQKIDSKGNIHLLKCHNAIHGNLYLEPQFQEDLCEFLTTNRLPCIEL